MKEKAKRPIREELEGMTTAQLDEILDRQLHSQVPDGAQVRQILAVLEEREREISVTVTPGIQTAWDRFRKETAKTDRASRRYRTFWVWALRAASLMLVLTVLVAAIPQETQAENLWEKVGRWTDEVFSFFSSREEPETGLTFQTDNPGLQQIHDTLTEMGVTEPVVPMWLPEGYALVECKVKDVAGVSGIYARFSTDDKYIIFELNLSNQDVSQNCYKDETEISRFEKAGIVHNIMRNEDIWVVVWTNNDIRCLLTLDCQEDTLYEILRSIYSTGE